MKFSSLSIPGVVLVETEPHVDERGLFSRTVCSEQFKKQGLPAAYCQSSTSFNLRKGTLRGLHYQRSPSREEKLVRCTQGAIYDVVVDLRPDSLTFKKWLGCELSAANRIALAIPHGCAHGFITLTDDAEVLYMMSEPQAEQYASGVRWDDPSFAISWPLMPSVLSEKDAAWPDFAG